MTSDISDKRDSNRQQDRCSGHVIDEQPNPLHKVGKGFYLSTMNSEEDETQILSTSYTIFQLIFDKR
jgi:hypothetical protein